VNGYVHLYDLLSGRLFPSFTQWSVEHADDGWPAVVVMYGAATPVVGVLAGFVAPYVAARQSEPAVSEIELLGLMNILLEELEAGDLPGEEYRRLCVEGAVLLRRLLTAPVRHHPLTTFDRPVLGDIVPHSAPAPPSTLPELPDDENATETIPLTGYPPVPLSRDERRNRRPPIPDLPEDEE
jgi:hypothetical protein